MGEIRLRVKDSIQTKGLPEGIEGSFVLGHLVQQGEAAFEAFMFYKDSKPYMILSDDVEPADTHAMTEIPLGMMISPFSTYPRSMPCLCGSMLPLKKCCEEHLPKYVPKEDIPKMKQLMKACINKYKKPGLEIVKND